MVDLDLLRANLLTQGAEHTCEQLMTSAAEHDRTQSVPTEWPVDPSDGGYTALSYVTRLVILVEVFTFGRVIEMSDKHAEQVSSPAFDSLYREHRRRIDASWEKALKALKIGWPSIGTKQYAEYPALLGYIEARNSWAHGHGVLTRRQSKDIAAARGNLSRAGFALVGNRVHVEPRQVHGVARTCREFVRKVDLATRVYV